MAQRYVIANRLFNACMAIVAIPHIVMVNMSPARAVIVRDVERWCEERGPDKQENLRGWWRLVWLLLKLPEFRNLLYYRVEMAPHMPSRLLLVVARWTLKPINTLFLYTMSIGPGLFIEHGFSTVIAANRIGRNCWINQQVTIGYSNRTDCPTIGDNVRICAGAKVFGNVVVGNNVIVGANAVVCKSVPPNCTVVGVPAYIIKRDGVRVKEPL